MALHKAKLLSHKCVVCGKAWQSDTGLVQQVETCSFRCWKAARASRAAQ